MQTAADAVELEHLLEKLCTDGKTLNQAALLAFQDAWADPVRTGKIGNRI